MWNKESYKSLAWAGIGIGLLVIVLNFAATEGNPSGIAFFIGLGLLILGLWSSSRARRWEQPPASGLEARLAELDRLRDAGTITEQEHEEARRKALGAP